MSQAFDVTEPVIISIKQTAKTCLIYLRDYLFIYLFALPGGFGGKESACNAGDLGWIPGLRRSPGGGKGYSLQYSGLENSMDRGAWWATVHRVTKSRTQLKRLSTHTYEQYTSIQKVVISLL